ncbi:MAG: SdiA-regulated domain-containing protein [Bacteroidota bacterium]
MKSGVRLIIVGFFSLLASCRPEPIVVDYSIILDSYELSIAEPSGLAFSTDKESLYTVSDRGMLYQISLTGNTIKELPFAGDDFEGVTVNPLTSDIYVIEEGKGKLNKLDNKGVFQESYNILDNSGNSGLEGLTYDVSRNVFYMLKEKSDGLLIKYSVTDGSQTEIKLNFAYDYSGIFYNSSTDKLWIVSDESKTLTQCTNSGQKIKEYKLPISGVEGVVVNNEETEAYLVSDPNNMLYKINLIE